MAKKNILVLGLRTLGQAIVKELYKYDCDVLAIDKNMEMVEDVAEYVTEARQIDIQDVNEVKQISLNDFDIAIITVNDMASSIMAALLFKEAGIPYVIVKSTSEVHKKILEKMNVDKIISPETDMGVKIAKNIMNENIIDSLSFSEEYSIVEVETLEKWVGKSLEELNFRDKYKMNIVCVKRKDKEPKVLPQKRYIIEQNDILIGICKGELSIGKK